PVQGTSPVGRDQPFPSPRTCVGGAGYHGETPGRSIGMNGIGFATLTICVLAGCRAEPAPASGAELFRYLRRSPGGMSLECSFAVDRRESGWTITSVTGGLSVTARYDAADGLLDATARLGAGDPARVEVAGGRAKTLRAGREA